MPSLPAPPAPLLLLGLLLLCSQPARGAGPEHPALPIRPEKEPLPIRGAAGRWTPRGRRGWGVLLGASLRPPGGGAGCRWLGAAGGPEGWAGAARRVAPGDPGPGRQRPGRVHGRSGTAAASQVRPRRLLLRREGLCLGRDVAPGPGGALRGDALRVVCLRGGEWTQWPWPGPSRVGDRWGLGTSEGLGVAEEREVSLQILGIFF